MAVIGFIKTFIFFFLATFLFCSVVGRFIPGIKKKGWKIRLAFILLSAGFAYYQGLGVIQRFAQDKLDSIQHNTPPSDIDIGYFVGDFLPTLKLLRGTITPEMWDEVQHIAKEGSAGHAAMAKKLLGENPTASPG